MHKKVFALSILFSTQSLLSSEAPTISETGFIPDARDKTITEPSSTIETTPSEKEETSKQNHNMIDKERDYYLTVPNNSPALTPKKDGETPPTIEDKKKHQK